MKMKSIIKTLLLSLTAVLLLGAAAKAQRKSPHQTATGTIKGAHITITYGSPGVKGRTIWGGLVPYDKPWRAGADEATILETDKDINIGGQHLPAGKYTLFITPSQDKWLITLNSETGQWGIKRTGEANFDPAKNVATFTTDTQKSSDLVEQLTYEVTSKGITIAWEHLKATIAVKP